MEELDLMLSCLRQFLKVINAAPVGATINVRSHASNKPTELRCDAHGARCPEVKPGAIWHFISLFGPWHAGTLFGAAYLVGDVEKQAGRFSRCRDTESILPITTTL